MKKLVSLALSFLMVALMLIPCFATNSYPSVQQKEAPTVVENSTGVVNKKTGEKTDVELVVASYKQVIAGEADVPEKAVEELRAAFNEINDFGSLSKLKNENGETIKKDLQKALDSAYPNSGYKADLLVAQYLFEIDPKTADTTVSENDDLYYTVTFEASNVAKYVENGIPPIVMHRHNGSWVVVDPKDVILEEDGSLTILFENLCPVVFLTISQERLETSRVSLIPLIIIVAIIVAIGVVVFVLLMVVRKSKNDVVENADENDTKKLSESKEE